MTKVPLFSSGPAQYAIFRAMAIGFVCLYPVGIPLVFASILAANRDALSEDNSQSMDFKDFLVWHPLETESVSPDSASLSKRLRAALGRGRTAAHA